MGEERKRVSKKKAILHFGKVFYGKILSRPEKHSTYPFFIQLICALQISVKNDLHGLSVPAQRGMMQSSPTMVVTVKKLRKDMCIHFTDEMWEGIIPI